MSKTLEEFVAELPPEKLKLFLIRELEDGVHTDCYIRDRVKNVLTEWEVYGDSYGKLTIEQIVDFLVNRIENLEYQIGISKIVE